MARGKRKGNQGIFIIVLVLFIAGIGIFSSVDFDGITSGGVMPYDKAVEKLAKQVEDVTWSARHVQASGGVTVQKIGRAHV